MPKNKRKKEMTINDLAVMVQKGFVETGKDAAGLKNDIAEIDKRLDRIEFHMNSVRSRGRNQGNSLINFYVFYFQSLNTPFLFCDFNDWRHAFPK